MALKTLYFVDDIMKRYRCRSKDTARRYMRQMGAAGSPLFVTEEMINEFDYRHRKSEKEKKVRKRQFTVPKGVTEIPGRRVG